MTEEEAENRLGKLALTAKSFKDEEISALSEALDLSENEIRQIIMMLRVKISQIFYPRDITHITD